MDMIQVWNMMCTYIVVGLILFLTILAIIVILMITRSDALLENKRTILVTYLFLGGINEHEKFISEVKLYDTRLSDYSRISKEIIKDICDATNLEENDIPVESFVILNTMTIEEDVEWTKH